MTVLQLFSVNRVHDWFGSLLKTSTHHELTLALHQPLEKGDEKNLVDVGVAPACTIFVKFKGTLPGGKKEGLFGSTTVDGAPK